MADEIGQIQKSAALGASLERAHRLALEQGHGAVTLEHLLFAMTDDPEAATVLVASGLSMDRLRTEVSGYIARVAENLPRLGPSGALPNQDFLRVLNLAATAARQSQRSSIDGAIVLAAIVGDGKTTAAALLKSQGLTFEEVIKVLSRHAAGRPAPAQPPAAQIPPPPAAPPSAPAPAEVAPGPGGPGPGAPGPGAAAPSPGPAPGAARPSTDDLLQTVRERVKLSEPPRIAVRGPAMQLPMPDAPPAVAAAPAQPPAAPPPPPSFPSASLDAPSPVRRPPPRSNELMAAPAPPQQQPPQQMTPQPAPPPDRSAPPAPAPQPALQADQPPRLPPRLPPQVGPPPVPAPPPRTEARAPAGEPYPSGPPPQMRSGPHGASPGPQAATPPPPPPPGFGSAPPPRPGAPPQSRVPSLDQRLAEYRPQDVRGGQPLPAHMLQAPPPPPAPAPQQAPPQTFHAPARATDGGFAPPRPDLAQAALGIPEQMTIGRPSRVEVRLDPVDFLGGPSAVRGPAPASRSRPLRAVSLRLFDETGAFAIEPETDETRWLDAGQPSALTEPLVWSFLVTPRARGTRALGISLDTRAIGPLGFIGEPPIAPEMVEVRVRRDIRPAMRRLFLALMLAASGAAVWATTGGVIMAAARSALRLAGLR